MIQKITGLDGLKIIGIEIRTDDDVSPEPGCAHMAYEIVIKTELGFASIRGCHDQGPEATVCRSSINPIQ